MMLLKHLSLAIRNLVRHKTTSLINIVGLSTAITCCLVLFIFIRYESSFDNHAAVKSQTYRVVQDTKFPEQMLFWNTTAYPLAEALRADFSQLSNVTQVAGPFTRTFSIGEKSEIKQFEESTVLFVDSHYPEVFKLHWLAGDSLNAFHDIHSIVLTEKVAQTFFETRNYNEVLGNTVLLQGKDPLVVKGVVKDPPGNISLKYKILIPYQFFRINNPYPSGNWSGNYQGTTFVVLNEQSTASSIEPLINNWKKKYMKPEDDQRITYRLQPLSEIHNNETYGSSPGSYTISSTLLLAASLVGVFILIIASINFVNLSTAQAAQRMKEVAIRKIVGSSKVQLIKQFLTENILVIGITAIISIGLAQIALANLNQVLGFIGLVLTFEVTDLVTLVAIAIMVILLAGIYPAIAISSATPAEGLKKKLVSGAEKGMSFRKSLIVFQFAITQVFIIATIVVTSQMHFIRNTDLGFNQDNVIIVPTHGFQSLQAFKTELMQSAGVADVSFGSGPPTAINDFMLGTTFRLPGQSEIEGKETEMKVVDEDYLGFYRLTLLAGRNLNAPREGFSEFIVNENLLSYLGWKPEEAIGKKLVINEGEATIVGVVKDFHNTSLQENITPCLFTNWVYYQDNAFIRTSQNANLTDALEAIETSWRKFWPGKYFKFAFLDEGLEKNYRVETLILTGFVCASALSVVLGSLGLLGLVSFMTLRRTKEVGIRKVLGASVAQIIRLFTNEFIVLILLAFVIAFPIVTISMREWLDHFSYKVDLSWWMFASGVLLLLVVALASISYQCLRAATANPVDSLRSE
jgi:putative ABC transport system permease protein